MYELKKFGKVFRSKFVGTGPYSYKKKGIYRAAISQRMRNTDLKGLSHKPQRTQPELQTPQKVEI